MTAHAGGLSLATTYVLDSEQNVAPPDGDRQRPDHLLPVRPGASGGARRKLELLPARRLRQRVAEYSVRKLADSTGEIVLERSYTPWGDVLSQSGTLTPAHGYLGGWVDAVTGLIYEAVLFTAGNGQYYDPATGRFLTRDAQPGQFNAHHRWFFMG